MSTDELIQENLYLKISLSKMLCQFYEARYSLGELYRLGVPIEQYGYTAKNGYRNSDEVSCVFHMFSGAGESAYRTLGLEGRDIYLVEEIWDREKVWSDKLLEMRNYRS